MDLWEDYNYDDQFSTVSISDGMLVLISLFYLLAFGAAEFTYYNLNNLAGFIIYLVALFSLIILGAVAGSRTQRGLWLALGLAPLMRIIGIAMPVASEILRPFWYIGIAIPVFAGIFSVIRNLDFTLSDVGLNLRDPGIQLLACITGLGFGSIDYFILKPAAWTTELTIQSTWAPAFVLLVFVGLMEELVFRGVILRAFDRLGVYGIIYVAALYSVLQIGQGSVLHCVFAFFISLYFGWLVRKTGSIIGVGIAHGLINIALFLVLPYFF